MPADLRTDRSEDGHSGPPEQSVWAARRGLAFVTLETGAANHPARALYAQRGYHEEDIRLTKALT